MRDVAFLVTNGVSYETALSLSPTRRHALCVAIGEQLGGDYDWTRLRWVERKQ